MWGQNECAGTGGVGRCCDDHRSGRGFSVCGSGGAIQEGEFIFTRDAVGGATGEARTLEAGGLKAGALEAGRLKAGSEVAKPFGAAHAWSA